MTPRAYIVHQVHGRLRLRIKEKRGDPEYFEGVQVVLAAISDDIHARVNDSTGSILLTHPQTPYSEVEMALGDIELFDIADGPEPEVNALMPLVSGISGVNRALAESTSGRIDLRTIVVIAAMALVLRQLLRGQITAPAIPLLWSTLDLAMRLHRTISKN